MNPLLAAAATTLIGVPFRLHGRDPATGLDCVGLVAEAMRRAGARPTVPAGYRLRAMTIEAMLPFAEANGFEAVTIARPGDVVLAMVNPVQPHLLVCTHGGFVHAHSALGRVTFLPGGLPWAVSGAWQVPTITPSSGN
ncbi:peptidoglycan endopeptidase [Novosphingobium sp.]|uniref:peptidoglycan endopeptidase n=1 Tax=Novosphingobium sp. TaxID=1874826 RepID=UPI00263535F4|nr:peptidoglycan endopeptidase [Novosphingobium sp.]